MDIATPDQAGNNSTDRSGSYHHGDLKNALLTAARTMLENQTTASISFRGVARAANVSHAAPYRHFASQEALLAEVARHGFIELRDEISTICGENQQSQISSLCRVYMGYIRNHPALSRLMFESQILNRQSYPALRSAARDIGVEIGIILNNTTLGLSVWGALHGMAMLMLEDIIEFEHSPSNIEDYATRAEHMLNTLASPRDMKAA